MFTAMEAVTWTAEPDGTKARIAPSVGGWTVERSLGGGPVCDSWLVTRADETAVLRVLREPFASDERTRIEWMRASWAANRFNHNRVLKVIEQGLDPRSGPFVVRAWSKGETLDATVRRGTLGVGQTLRLGEHLLDALEMAHAHGILHGALSPSNVVITPRGSARVLDFATTPGLLARRSGFADTLTAARIGPFMPPERCTTPAAPTSEQSDVWSVGACLYYALVGKAPPAGKTSALAMPLLRAVTDVNDDVAAVIAFALSADPLGRYDSAYAMLGDVRRLLAGKRPKLDGALAPVPSQSLMQGLALPAQGGRLSTMPPSSSAIHGLTPPPVVLTASRESRGNVVLVLAIALLVVLATFVLVRERLSEPPAAHPSGQAG